MLIMLPVLLPVLHASSFIAHLSSSSFVVVAAAAHCIYVVRFISTIIFLALFFFFLSQSHTHSCAYDALCLAVRATLVEPVNRCLSA